MLNLIAVWILSAAALLITAKIVKGFELKGFKSALLASFIIGLLNVIIRPILLLLTLPINFLTLGLFTFVVNAIILKASAGLLEDFKIIGWLPAILAAVVIAIINMIFFQLFGVA